MFGFRFIKFQPSMYILKYRGGKIIREGAGLSFFYYQPTTSLAAIPVTSNDVPFIFQEATSDFQQVTIQGQVTYRILDPKKIAGLLNYSLDQNGVNYVSDDPGKLPQRVINLVQVLTKKELKSLDLRASLQGSEVLVQNILAGLAVEKEIVSAGLEILGLSILAVKPTPETARALEAQAREQIYKEADEAIYYRRNFSIDQERSVKENELNTEIAVENKKRQMREAQLEAEKSIQEKKHGLEETEIQFQIAQELKRKNLVAASVENGKVESSGKAFAVSAVMKALEGSNPELVKALAQVGMEPNRLIAAAFQGLAEKAEKIGELNVSPELLTELLKKK